MTGKYKYCTQCGAVWWVYRIIAAAALLALAIVIPNLLYHGTQPAMASAISLLRTISSAEELYKGRYGAYASLAQLAEVRMIDNILGGGEKQNYYFHLSYGPGWWCCVARPAVWGAVRQDPDEWRTDRNYLTRQDGVIRWNSEEDSGDWSRKVGE